MGKFLDFHIHNAESLQNEELAKAIFNRIFVARVQSNKPCVIMLVGDSGEGKSYSALRLCEILGDIQGFKFADYVQDCVVHTPMEYPMKMKAMKEDPRLKDVNIIVIDEAREVVKASQWYSFVNQAIADINATFRRIKPMIVIVLTQFVMDVDPKVRRTIQFYGNCSRPLGGKARIRLFRMWKDDRDIQKPALRKRRVNGYLVINGRYVHFKPKDFVMNLASKEVVDRYEEDSLREKGKLINFKLDKLMVEMKKQYGELYSRVAAAVELYSQSPELLEQVGKRVRGKIKIRDEVQRMLGFTDDELDEFKKRLMEKVKEKEFAEVKENGIQQIQSAAAE